jgi:hypothetical protein
MKMINSISLSSVDRLASSMNGEGYDGDDDQEQRQLHDSPHHAKPPHRAASATIKNISSWSFMSECTFRFDFAKPSRYSGNFASIPWWL